uniref:VEFS-Box domain-containing protein n=1 Tax=Dracunculus medinensis TaxID=318479 RepID=A0A0N4UPL1_DRAME
LQQLTNAPVYKQIFINSVRDIPLDFLLQNSPDESIPVCDFIPSLNPCGLAATLSFIVDTNRVPVCDLSSDNLGQWNTKDGQRMSVRKFYYKEKLKCAEGEHDFCVIRRKYTHPHCVPPNSVRKVIWYAVISYFIDSDAQVPIIPHGNSKKNDKGYVRTRPSEIRKRLSKSKYKYSEINSYPLEVAISDADVDVIDEGEEGIACSSDEGNSDIIVVDPLEDSNGNSYSDINISDEEMIKRIAEITTAPLFSCKYINAIGQVPIELLRRSDLSADLAPVNYSVPQIQITGKGVCMSFIVECSQIPIPEFRRVIYIDAKILGSWNTKCGKRVSVYKFFFNKSKMKCLEGEHEYCVLRKKYVHPFANPPNSVRKVIWLVRRFDKTYYRFLSLNRFYEYVLITYRIQDDAVVERHISKSPHRTYQPLPPMEPVDEEVITSEIMRITQSPVYLKRFINNIQEFPFQLLLTPWNLDEPVCYSVPHIDILREPTKVAVQLSFIIDTSKVAVSDLSTDNLGQWNTSHGRRMTLRKFFFNREKRRCLREDHYYVVTRKTYVHPNSIPDGAVRKIIWQLSTDRGFTRYALITFDIGAETVVEAIPHGNSKTNTEVYVRREPSLTINERRAQRRIERTRQLSFYFLLYLSTSPSSKRSRLTAPSSITLYGEEFIEGMDGTYLTHEDLMIRMAQSSSRRYTRPYHNDEPFNLVFLMDQNVGLIQCASCGVDFSRHAHPPEDIVLEHIERFWNQRTGCFSLQQMQKRYIHARLECVLSRYEYFTTVDFLSISPDVRMRLTDAHQQYLSVEFGCSYI